MVPVELQDWARRHQVTGAAIAELSGLLGALASPVNVSGGSEGRVQSLVRLTAPALGFRLFRNNVGVLKDLRGVPVRFGLANDSKRLNDQFKSSDLIGWRRLPVTPEMVGSCVAQFVSLECKAQGWTYRGDDHEQAQQRWLALAAADGGHARFITRVEDI